MFQTLFRDPAVLRRHREGPLLKERVAYLQELASSGLAHGTMVGRAVNCLRVAVAISRHPPEHVFGLDEVGALLPSLNDSGPAAGEPVRSPSPARFRATAIEFLDSLGRLRPDPPRDRGEHEDKLDTFLARQREFYWQSEATCRTARWHLQALLDHLHQRAVALCEVTAEDLDRFFEAMSLRWSRGSLAGAAGSLRQWLDYCAQRGWVRPGLGATIQGPRRHRLEGLPIGPPWETVGRMLDAIGSDEPAAIRDRAILLLLSVYGVRSGEVGRLCLDDIDWSRDRIVFERSKSRRREEFALHPLVGEAIVRYLRLARPRASSRWVFLTVRAPHRPLTAVALHGIVQRRYPEGEVPPRGRGPHGLRHNSESRIIPSRQWNLGGARTFARIGLGIITGCSGRPGPRHQGGTGPTSLALESSWPGPLPSA